MITSSSNIRARALVTAIGLCVSLLLALASGNNTATPTGPIGSPDQVEFHQEFARLAKAYESAPNEMKKSAVYREMASFVRSHVPTATVQNWEGKITSIGTEEGGRKAYLEIQQNLGGMRITYQTYNNSLSDIGNNSMILLGSPVYRELENLKEGDVVVFSGRFFLDSESGYEQTNMLEETKVTDPEMLMVFSSLKKKQ